MTVDAFNLWTSTQVWNPLLSGVGTRCSGDDAQGLWNQQIIPSHSILLINSYLCWRNHHGYENIGCPADFFFRCFVSCFMLSIFLKFCNIFIFVHNFKEFYVMASCIDTRWSVLFMNSYNTTIHFGVSKYCFIFTDKVGSGVNSILEQGAKSWTHTVDSFHLDILFWHMSDYCWRVWLGPQKDQFYCF